MPSSLVALSEIAPRSIGKLLVKQSDFSKLSTKSTHPLPGVVTRFNVARVCGTPILRGPPPRGSPRRSVSVMAEPARKDRRSNARSLQLSQPSSGEKSRNQLTTPTTVGGESWTWNLDSSSSPRSEAIPPFPEIKENPPPTFLEFTASLLAAEGMVVRLQKKGDDHCLQIIDEGFAELVHAREGQFTEALHKGWTDCHIELIKASPLFSQATINQTSDVQESPWFLDEHKQPMKVQTQLLSQVYNATHPRDVFGDYYSAGPLGLSLSWDTQKYPEKRRIQNALRRYLEFSLEAFLLEVCLSKDANLTDISAAQAYLHFVLHRPSLVGPLLRAQFQQILTHDSRPHDGEGRPHDSRSPTSCDSRLSLKAMDAAIEKLGWWPRELNQNDRTELLEAISLASIRTQLAFVKNTSFPHAISERDYVLALQWVPMNQPDFASEDGKEPLEINAVLEAVVHIANTLTKFIAEAEDSLESRTLARETELGKLRAGHANSSKSHSNIQSFQLRGCVRNEVFAVQDFILSNCVSLEELQMVYVAASNPPSNEEVTPASIAQMIHETHTSCSLPDLRLIALALDYMIGITQFNMSHSERFTTRSPLSTLSVRIEHKELPSRFKRCPVPLPPRPDCMPRAEAHHPPTTNDFTVQFLSPAEARLENRKALERTKEALDAACHAQWFGADNKKRKNKSLSLTSEELPPLQVHRHLLEPLVILHATETLHHVQKLFVPSAQVNLEELQVSLNDEQLHKGDRQTWSKFWRQSLDLSGSLSSLSMSGLWGPMRWNSLREISLAFQALKK